MRVCVSAPQDKRNNKRAVSYTIQPEQTRQDQTILFTSTESGNSRFYKIGFATENVALVVHQKVVHRERCNTYWGNGNGVRKHVNFC